MGLELLMVALNALTLRCLTDEEREKWLEKQRALLAAGNAGHRFPLSQMEQNHRGRQRPVLRIATDITRKRCFHTQSVNPCERALH